MIKIMIADDHPVVRSGLRALLSSQSDFEIVDEASNGEEACGFSQAVEKTCKEDPYRKAFLYLIQLLIDQ